MNRTPVWRAAALALALVLGAGRLAASHYPLNAIDLTTSDETFALMKAGVTDTEELLGKTARVSDRAALAKATGIALARLGDLARLADLLSVRGIGPTVARLLAACEVRTRKDLAAAKAVDLAACMKAVNLRDAITDLLPSQEFLQQWIDAVQGVEVRVE